MYNFEEIVIKCEEDNGKSKLKALMRNTMDSKLNYHINNTNTERLITLISLFDETKLGHLIAEIDCEYFSNFINKIHNFDELIDFIDYHTNKDIKDIIEKNELNSFLNIYTLEKIFTHRIKIIKN